MSPLILSAQPAQSVSNGQRCLAVLGDERNTSKYGRTRGISWVTIVRRRPEAMLSKQAISSTWSSMRSASLFKHFARCSPENLDHFPPSNCLLAKSNALSTSSALAAWRSLEMMLSSFGFFNSITRPVPGTHQNTAINYCQKEMGLKANLIVDEEF